MKELKAIDFRFFIGSSCYINDIIPIVSTIDGIDKVLNTVISKTVNYGPGLIKPILRRFETLSRHEIEELNKLWPKENIRRNVTESIKLDAEVINYLSSLSIDVFDWISQGLAIDAAYNTKY